MRFLRGNFIAAAALCAGMFVPCLAAGAQTNSNGPMTALERRSPQQMDAADAGLIQAKQRDIATEAEFYGYDLSSASYSYSQVVCPQLPDYVLLHYRSVTRNGALSLFTALVPRGAGRVQVVPVLYRNATPYGPAAGADRTMRVFNRAVPADVARAAAQPNGDWIGLAMTYAAVAGADPGLVTDARMDPALYAAPHPTAEVSAADRLQRVRFAVHDEVGRYTVWSVAFNNQGHVTDGSTDWFPIPDARPATEPSAAPVLAESWNPPDTRESPAPASEPATPATPAAATVSTANAATEPAAPVASAQPAAPAIVEEPAHASIAAPTQPAPAGKLIPQGPPLKMKLIPQGPPPKMKLIPPAPQSKESPMPPQ